jgi:hypothetical protein
VELKELPPPIHASAHIYMVCKIGRTQLQENTASQFVYLFAQDVG